jgi:hypothetical protein
MSVQYFTAFAWGIIVLLAFIGYGRLLNIILSPAKKFDLGMQAALGLVLSVVVGGLFNLVGIISVLSIKIFVSIGVVSFLVFWLRNYRTWPLFARRIFVFIKTNKLFSVAVAVIFVIIFVRYGFAVSFFGFNGSDDHHGYMAFPAKMLQTGSLGNDPFSERRIESSLGGQYFLHAIILAQTSFRTCISPTMVWVIWCWYFCLLVFLKKKKSIAILFSPWLF